MKTMTAKDLKNALLQEAVQGRLVPQCAADGNARTLLDAIRAEKQKSAKSKSSKPFPPIADDEIPFEIPDSWVWVRLGELITFIGGYAYDSHSFIEKSEYQVLRLGNVKNGYLQLSAKPVYIDAELAEKTNAFKCNYNDILVTMTGTRLKRDYFFTTLISENDKNLYVNQRVGCLRPSKIIFANFLVWILKSKPILDYIFEFETGTANQGNLGSENIKTIPIPLPPLAEQHRIVSAIEKLLPLIDEYGKKELVINALNSTIGQTAKKAILQEAVQGRLVPQCAADGNARALLDAIRAEKQKSSKSKSSKPLPPIADDEIPFDIPDNWVWVRLGEIVDVRDGTHNSPAYIDKAMGYPLITSKDFRGNYFDLSKTQYISKDDYDEINLRSKVDIGDILFSMIGGNIGNKIIITQENYFEMAIKNVALFKKNDFVINKYLFYFLDYSTKTFQDCSIGGAQTFVSLKFFRTFPIPLPPLAEQRRIVSAIEKLLPMCERLGRE